MGLYDLMLIRPNLRHEETIIQTSQCLELLTNVITSVFDQIDARIEQNTKKLSVLDHRTAAVKAKVNSLIGINKAITIFSPQKYPASTIAHDSAITFTPTAGQKPISPKVDYTIECKPEPISRRTIDDKLQFHYVASHDESIQQEKQNRLKSTKFANGVGPFPKCVESINELLLFNEVKNMYENDNATEVSGRSKKRKNTVSALENPNQINPNKMDQLLLPTLNRNLNTKKIDESLFYMPNITNAPELDVPQFLPDLPGIADDIEFNVSNIDDMLIVSSQLNVETIESVPDGIVEQTAKLREDSVSFVIFYKFFNPNN